MMEVQTNRVYLLAKVASSVVFDLIAFFSQLLCYPIMIFVKSFSIFGPMSFVGLLILGSHTLNA
jgi:hypothetical protein